MRLKCGTEGKTMADLKQNTSPQPPRAIGPGGPGGHRGNMHARIMREKPKNIRGTLSKLMKYIGRSKFLILLLLLVVIIATALNLAGPELQGRAIDSISVDNVSGRLTVDFDSLIHTLTLMGVVYILSACILNKSHHITPLRWHKPSVAIWGVEHNFWAGSIFGRLSL